MVDFVGSLIDYGCMKFAEIQDNFDRGFDQKIWTMVMDIKETSILIVEQTM